MGLPTPEDGKTYWNFDAPGGGWVMPAVLISGVQSDAWKHVTEAGLCWGSGNPL